MSYVPPKYPGAIPTYTDVWPWEDVLHDVTVDKWDAMTKELRAALLELGVNPRGTHADVAARLTAATRRSFATVYLSKAYSVAHTSDEIIEYDTVLAGTDPGAEWDDEDFFFKAKTAGLYIAHHQIGLTGCSGTVSYYHADIWHNLATKHRKTERTSTVAPRVPVTAFILCATNDTLSAGARQTDGAARDAVADREHCYFTVARINAQEAP